MPLSHLTVAQLESLIPLVKEKETLLARLQQIDRTIDSLSNGKPTTNFPTIIREPRAGGARRGRLKNKILKILGAAGKDGATVADLAKRLKTDPARIATWFYTTGKKTSGIKRVDRSRYAYQLGSPGPKAN